MFLLLTHATEASLIGNDYSPGYNSSVSSTQEETKVWDIPGHIKALGILSHEYERALSQLFSSEGGAPVTSPLKDISNVIHNGSPEKKGSPCKRPRADPSFFIRMTQSNEALQHRYRAELRAIYQEHETLQKHFLNKGGVFLNEGFCRGFYPADIAIEQGVITINGTRFALDRLNHISVKITNDYTVCSINIMGRKIHFLSKAVFQEFRDIMQDFNPDITFSTDIPWDTDGVVRVLSDEYSDDDETCYSTDVSENPLPISQSYIPRKVFFEKHPDTNGLLNTLSSREVLRTEPTLIHAYQLESDDFTHSRIVKELDISPAAIHEAWVHMQWGNQCPFLAPALEIYVDPLKVLIDMKYYPYTLRSVLQKTMLLEEFITLWILEITLALDFLHQRGIVHRDIKLDNIFINEQGKAILADYGLCSNSMTENSKALRKVCGTSSTISPDILAARTDDTVYNHASDYYSLGVMFYQMLYRRSPFKLQHFDIFRDGYAALQERLKFPTAEELPMPQHYPNAHELVGVCQALLNPNPAARPTAKDIWSALHPLVADKMDPILASFQYNPNFL